MVKVTGRVQGGKESATRAVASASTDAVERSARIEGLRAKLKAGKYQVDPKKLALRIFARSLAGR
jgi:anti-sigma28 factor (negative regulator of flagellin synthesis)